MSEDFTRIASALERIADSLEKKWHIDIDHGHIEKIDNIEHGDIDTHAQLCRCVYIWMEIESNHINDIVYY